MATDSFGVGATSAVVNLLVNARPVIALTSPANHAAFTALATVPLTASAGDADGTVAAVEFYEGVSRLATVTSAPYIFIWSGVATGNYTLTARVTDERGAVASTPPAALTVGPTAFVDSFADRATMNGFTNYLTGHNAAFTREAGEPAHNSNTGTHSGWVAWTAQASGACTMDTMGSSFDTVLAVYTGTVLSNLTRVASNDDLDAQTLQSRVTFSAVAG